VITDTREINFIYPRRNHVKKFHTNFGVVQYCEESSPHQLGYLTSSNRSLMSEGSSLLLGYSNNEPPMSEDPSLLCGLEDTDR
jgi:hypothetical protein